MQTVLLCDAAFSALPVLFALRRRGFRVAVCGGRPDDPGHRLADRSFVADYSNPDTIVKVAREAEADFLVPGCTDVSYLSSAQAAAVLGLRGFDAPEVAAGLLGKREFRALCRAKGFRAPKSVESTAYSGGLKFPVLVKPSRSYSGRGIVRVERSEDLPGILEELFPGESADEVILEEFVPGDLYSHSALLSGGRIVWDIFVREYCTIYPYQVNSSFVAPEPDDGAVRGMRHWAEQCATEVGLADGLLHTQFIWDGYAAWLVEVTRRCPGDLYALLVERSTGADYARAFVSGFVGGVEAPTADHGSQRFVSRHTLSVAEGGAFLSASIDLPDAQWSYVPLKRPGEYLDSAPRDRAGIFFIEHQSAEAMVMITPRLKEYAHAELAGRD